MPLGFPRSLGWVLGDTARDEVRQHAFQGEQVLAHEGEIARVQQLGAGGGRNHGTSFGTK
jgi:hypothetical protein